MRPGYFGTLSVILVVVGLNQSLAQSDSIRVQVFDGKGQTQPSTSSYDKNFVRLNYYLFARGAITIGYERILADRHAICIDAGLTYRDFIYEVLFHDDFDFDGVTAKAGKYLDVAYKFYPGRYHNFDGEFYISPGAIVRNYNIFRDVTFYDGTNNRTQKVDQGYSMREGYLKFGYVTDGLIFRDMIVDYYFGFGYRKVTSNGYDIRDGGFGTQKIVANEEVRTIPALYLGVKVGLAF